MPPTTLRHRCLLGLQRVLPITSHWVVFPVFFQGFTHLRPPQRGWPSN
jgi:hypothetical protein